MADKSIDDRLQAASATLVTDAPAYQVADNDVIQVLEETVRVGKRAVETGRAKVHVFVSERDQAIETLLTRQDVVIERVRLDRQVEAAPPVRQEGDTIIVSLVEERAVVEKRLFVIEEMRVRIEQAQRLDTQTVRLRREEAEVHESVSPVQPTAQGSLE